MLKCDQQVPLALVCVCQKVCDKFILRPSAVSGSRRPESIQAIENTQSHGACGSRRCGWGARGPGFKSRQPDQIFQSDAGDYTGSRRTAVDDFVDEGVRRLLVKVDRGVRSPTFLLPDKSLSIFAVVPVPSISIRSLPATRSSCSFACGRSIRSGRAPSPRGFMSITIRK